MTPEQARELLQTVFKHHLYPEVGIESFIENLPSHRVWPSYRDTAKYRLGLADAAARTTPKNTNFPLMLAVYIVAGHLKLGTVGLIDALHKQGGRHCFVYLETPDSAAVYGSGSRFPGVLNDFNQYEGFEVM
ncbi:MAG TPA: hypothetical protein VEA59_02450 [Patescibacteria group bacterium]|nr:hypothetical protein [Patescibacteria group bacterium]